MEPIKNVTQRDIRLATGPCQYCQENKVDWFCPNCWFGLCERCTLEDDIQKCMGDCFDLIPDLGDISIFDDK